MKYIMLAWVLGGCLIPSISSAETLTKPASVQACAPSVLPIDGNQLWVDKQGTGNVTVVFESGFGNDSSVWAQITPSIRAAGAQTLVYDRAGLGKSSINTATPYSFDNDVQLLRAVLTACGVKGPIVMVGHSYGGAISLLAAAEDHRIKAVVLLDAVVPGVWPKSELDANLKTMRAQYKEIREQAPDLAKVAIPWAEAMPATAARVDGLRLAESLPIVDIVAEKGRDNPASQQVWRNAHA
ncbi:alpha/beta fold hydrolase, partial [Dyella silvatica]|uniref:alpha/beta fold hydrolase n=1 Tax=Dyella silvatica TaxID=2992128 RepID=UPI00224F5107